MTDRRPIVLHLVDDATAGGVMRVVDFIQTSSAMAALGDHRVRHVRRGMIIGYQGRADVVVSHLAISWRSLPALMSLKLLNSLKRRVHVEHSYTEAFVAKNVKNKRRFNALLKLAFSLFQNVIAVSHEQASWIKTGGLCRTGKLATIQSCVDLAAFRQLPQRQGRVRIFAAIGRFDRQKGFDALITAFLACQGDDLRLHLYGEGEQEPMLRKLASGDDRIVFKGFTPDPLTAFADVDVVVMPSRWEAYGLVAIEALSAGRHLICADHDGLRDHAAGGAILVRPGSIPDLRDAMTAVVSRAARDRAKSPYRDAPLLEERFVKEWAKILTPEGHPQYTSNAARKAA